MPSLDDIKLQIKSLDRVSKYLGKREIKQLPDILWEDEVVENIVQGIYSKGLGILVATNKRLVFVDKGMIYGLTVETFPYKNISSIQYSTGLLYGKLTIFSSGNKSEIDNVGKKEVRLFSEFVRNKLSLLDEPSEIINKKGESVKSNSLPDRITQLERLAELKDKGIISEEEFTTEKQKILNS